MSINYKGYNSGTITCEKGDGLAVGYPVKFDPNNHAVPAGNGDEFVGICTAVRGDWASVQINGYVEMPYSGSITRASYVSLCADSNHKVKAGSVDATKHFKLLCLDATNSTIGFIL